MSEALNNIRSRIEALGINFKFIKPIKTFMNGIERETWLLEYEGSEFVFVKGQKNVVLGWDVDKCPLGEGVLEGLRKDFEDGHAYFKEERDDLEDYYQKKIKEAEKAGDSAKAKELTEVLEDELKTFDEESTEECYTSWDTFMRKWNENLSCCMSPLRTVDIGDMIVEVDNNYLSQDEPSLAHAVSSLKKEPFTLATEDEWEYLCNGGARTLFRWGDTLNDVLSEIYEVGTVSKDTEQTSSILERPNMLGLFIAYDSYQYEIIDNTTYVKGGDGGCSICGGEGAIYFLPCYTAFNRQQIFEDSYGFGLSKNYYTYRRIIRLP